jgi:sec-independent protein translocase protein TatC
MKRTLRPIGHEDRLSLVDHLDELRTRLIISASVLGVVFCFCFWQNHELLHIINKPLTDQTRKQVEKGEGTTGQAVLAQQAVVKSAEDTRRALVQLARPGSGVSSATRAQLSQLARALQHDVAKVPRNPSGDKPVTLGVGEAFTTTLTVAFYFSLIISLPAILYELFAFILPALRPNERRAAAPVLLAVPGLFIIGVLFGYFVVLPAAVRFFVNFNAGEFNNLVQGSQFYKFAATILLAMGAVFQVPVLIIGATRLGLVTPRQLRRYRRYAVVLCAAVAAFLPGDVITLLLETVPLYLLYEVSILLAALIGRARPVGGQEADGGVEGSPQGAPEAAPDHAQATVQQIIDHTDDRLS